MGLSFQQEVSDGVRSTYTTTFDFLDKENIFVYTGKHADYATQLSYQWVGTKTIELTNMAEVPAGSVFYIRRIVPRDRLVHTFANKSIRGALVDAENTHLIYLTQEFIDGFTSLEGIQAMFSDLDMNGYRIKNVGAPIELYDAVTKQHLDNRVASLNSSPQDTDHRIWGDRFVGAFEYGFVYSADTDIALGADSKYYKYIGQEEYPVVVAPGTIATDYPMLYEHVPVISPAAGGDAVRLSKYAEDTDISLHQAWERMLTSIQNPASPDYNKKDVHVDSCPNTPDGVWLTSVPSKFISGMQVTYSAKVNWNNTDTSVVYRRQRGMFEAIGELEDFSTSISQDIQENDNFLYLADVSGLSVDDFINIEIDIGGAQSAGYYPELYWVSRVVGIDGNKVYIDVRIPWIVQFDGTEILNRVTLVSVVSGVNITNPDFLDTSEYVEYVDRVGQEQPDYVIGPLFFQYVHNVHVQFVKGNRTKCPVVQFREFNNVSVQDLIVNNPDAIGPGEGYGAQFSRGIYARGRDFVGVNERHVVDFTSVFHYVAENMTSPSTAGTATFLNHGRFEAYGRWINCTGDSFSFGAGFTFGVWSKGQTWENVHVTDVGGERVLDWRAEKSSIKNWLTRMRTEKVVFDDCDMGVVIIGEETRLPSNGMRQYLDRGCYFNNGTVVGGGEVSGLSRLTISDSFLRYGGVLQRKLEVIDIRHYKSSNSHAERVEVTHSGEVDTILYSNYTEDFDFPEYASFGVGGVRMSGMTRHPDTDRVSIKFTTFIANMGNNQVSPIKIQRGSTTENFVYNLGITGFSSTQNPANITLYEDSGFYAVGNIYGNQFRNASVRVEDSSGNPTSINPRLMIGPNTYRDSAPNVDNLAGVPKRQTISLNFGATTVAAQDGKRSLITWDGATLTNPNSIVMCQIAGSISPKIAISTYYDTGSSEWKVQVANAGSAATTLPTQAYVTLF